MSATLQRTAVIRRGERRFPARAKRVFEPCPEWAHAWDFPEYGGLLFYNTETGLAGCVGCGWTGVPRITDGEFTDGQFISTRCPACEGGDYDAEMAALAKVAEVAASSASRVGRNQPCPCGSGMKAKRCPCDEYTV
jgi:hypothetical protein